MPPPLQTFPMTDVGRRLDDVERSAQRGDVLLTSRGKSDLVVLSAERYAELTRHEPRPAYAWELEPDELAAIRDQPPGHELAPTGAPAGASPTAANDE